MRVHDRQQPKTPVTGPAHPMQVEKQAHVAETQAHVGETQAQRPTTQAPADRVEKPSSSSSKLPLPQQVAPGGTVRHLGGFKGVVVVSPAPQTGTVGTVGTVGTIGTVGAVTTSPTKLSPRYGEAVAFAVALHADQTRKGTNIPYAGHLLAVSSIVLEHGGSESEAIAGLLHDALEDQGRPGLKDELRTRFGADVVKIVEGNSDTEAAVKPPWRERKESYIQHIAHADSSTRLVSLADKLHNARSLVEDHHQVGEKLWERFSGGRDGTLWYYRSLVDAFQTAGGHDALVTALDRTVAQLEARARSEPTTTSGSP